MLKNTEQFIIKAKRKHGDRYDYSKTEYKDRETEVCIICPIHGEFWQRPYNHLRGYGCKKCGFENGSKKNRSNTKEFIEKAMKLYGNRFTYEKVKYEKSSKKVCITCSTHGDFWTTPNTFLDGHICPRCAKEEMKEKMRYTTETFIKLAQEKHGNKYNYSKVIYKTSEEKVCIICPKHGEFWQTPHSHLNGCGCPKCKRENIGNYHRKTREEYINECIKAHGDKYDYSKLIYKNIMSKVEIICPIHGSFWQRAEEHKNGHGCPKCLHSTLEKTISDLLKDNSIDFIEHANKNDLPFLNGMHVDFYIPEYKIIIECQGEQHFKPVRFGGITEQEAQENYKKQVERDILKQKLCEENNLKIFYFSKCKNKKYKVFINEDEILNEIKDERRRILNVQGIHI